MADGVPDAALAAPTQPPPLGRDDDHDEESALWRACREGSDRARERLFNRYLPFARQIAARHFRDHMRTGIEFADLAQLASAGLLESIDHFDPALGAPFRAYARRRIAGSVVDGVSKMSEVREQIAFHNRLRRERLRSLAAREDGDAPPTVDALQQLVEVAVGMALGFMLEDAGLYITEGQPDTRASAYDSLAWKDTVRQVLHEVTALPDRERLIVRAHYLEGRTFDDIGDELGLTKGRVSQLHRVAIGLLRKRLRRPGDFRLER